MNVFTRHAFASAIAAAALVASSAGTASAQTIGTFSFALAPFCNNAVMTVTQEGSTYRLAGWDDNCGGDRFPLTGTIAPNANGTLNISFTVVRTTGIAVDTSIRNFALGSYTGAWTDSAGNSGTSGIIGLSAPTQNQGARPAPTSTVPTNSVTSVNIVNNSIEAADVNNTQIQLRVTGTCAAGSFIRSIDAAGNVVCGSGPATQSDEQFGLVNGLSNACENLSVITFASAPAGVVTCTGSTRVLVSHTTGGTASIVETDFSTVSASCVNSQSLLDLPPGYPTVTAQDFVIPVQRSFTVSAGTFTVFLTARTVNATTADHLAHTVSCTLTPQ